MVTAIIERMREAVAVPALGSSGRASLQRQLSSIGVRRSSGKSGRRVENYASYSTCNTPGPHATRLDTSGPGATTTLEPTFAFKRAVYDA